MEQTPAEIKKTNQEFIDKAKRVFWGWDDPDRVDIHDAMRDHAKSRQGWVDYSAWLWGDEADYKNGLKTAERSGLRLIWAQNPEQEPGIANVYSVAVFYYKDGRLEIISAGGGKTIPRFTERALREACADPVIETVDCAANRKANLEYFEKARAAFDVIRPVFQRYERRFSQPSDYEERETKSLDDQYSRGYARLKEGYASMSMHWKENLKLSPSHSSSSPDLTYDRCSVKMVYHGNDEIAILSGLPWDERLSREQWSNPEVLFVKLDRHFKDPRK